MVRESLDRSSCFLIQLTNVPDFATDANVENALIPMRNHGISFMSIGFLLPPSSSGEAPVAWRGMMVMKAVQQLLFDVDWRATSGSHSDTGLDILVIDMPPGTGDVALSLGQLVDVDGMSLFRPNRTINDWVAYHHTML